MKKTLNRSLFWSTDQNTEVSHDITRSLYSKTVLMNLNTDQISEVLDAVKNRRVSVKVAARLGTNPFRHPKWNL